MSEFPKLYFRHRPLSLNYAALAHRFVAWNDAEAWNVLQLIIVEQLGIKPERVTPEASFAEDLGMR